MQRPVLLRSFVSLLLGLSIQLSIESLDEVLGVVIDGRIGGRLEGKFVVRNRAAQLHVRVDNRDEGLGDLFDRALGALNSPVRAQTARIEDGRRRSPLEHQFIGPTVFLTQIKRDIHRNVGR